MGYYKLTPFDVDGLFFDRDDYHGILFLYDYLFEVGHLKKGK